jgi:phospholipase C
MGAGTPWHTLAKTKDNPRIQDRIDHIVVVMLENRSLDNVLGWLYYDKDKTKNNTPDHNIPPQNPPTYDGLVEDKYWNTTPPNDPSGPRDFATRGVTTYPDKTPYPHPGEVCPFIYEQMFGTMNPLSSAPADMSGFLRNYIRVGGDPPKQIMECYTPDQLPVLNSLARQFAVSDRWFQSLPCQTFSNRAFVHAGSSFGRLNNCNSKCDDGYAFDFRPYAYQKTIYQVLHDQGFAWKIYGPMGAGNTFPYLPFTGTSTQFYGTLLQNPLVGHTDSLEHFESDAKNGLLPAYAFVEPDFISDPTSDQHPAAACSMARGEQFIRRIWQAVSTGPKWENTILIFTYDEHGGCYDHVRSPRTATPPDDSPPQFEMPINPFTQYGPRIPAVVISPYVEAGTVFRSPSALVEFDHASILATLRDWIPNGQWKNWLTSERVKLAPTIWPVLTRTEPRPDIPYIPPAKSPPPPDSGFHELSSLQLGLVVAAVTARRFELERPLLGPAADHSAAYERINKEVLIYCEQHVKTADDAKRLLETP